MTACTSAKAPRLLTRIMSQQQTVTWMSAKNANRPRAARFSLILRQRAFQCCVAKVVRMLELYIIITA